MLRPGINLYDSLLSVSQLSPIPTVSPLRHCKAHPVCPQYDLSYIKTHLEVNWSNCDHILLAVRTILDHIHHTSKGKGENRR